MNIVHTWKFGLVSRLFLLQECFLTASGPTVYLAVAVHGYFSYLSQAESSLICVVMMIGLPWFYDNIIATKQ